MYSHLLLPLLVAVLAISSPSLALSPNVQTWTVNLDLPPASRWPWQDMIKVYGPSLLAAQALIGQFVPKDLQTIVEDVAEAFIDRLGPYGDEIRSSATQFNFSLGVAVLLNYIYEVEAGCTSIVVRTPNNEILHGRNLDFNLATVLQNLTTQVVFTRGGQPLYSAATFAGYVGVLTGVRNGGFSVSVDQRQQGTLFDNLLETLLVRNSTGVSIVVREVLENVDNFADAVTELSTRPIIAPVYYIVGGLQDNQGAIITRDRSDAVNVLYLNSTSWYQVETNYDPWLPDPPNDDRRTVAEHALDAVGQQDINLSTLFKVLSTHPVFNGGTTYTALLVPNNGTLITYSR